MSNPADKTNPLDARLPVWVDDEGAPITCHEKIKVMNENIEEWEQMVKDLLEDGVLMGCSEAQLRQTLHQLMDRVALTF